MYDKRVQIMPGEGMSAKCRRQIRSRERVCGTVIGIFVTTDMYRIALDEGIVLEGSEPLNECQHEILVPLANLRLIE